MAEALAAAQAIGDKEQFCCVNFFRAQFGYPRRFLGGQGIELSCGGQILAVSSEHLTLFDHMHEFDALQGDPSRVKEFKAAHQPDDPFN